MRLDRIVYAAIGVGLCAMAFAVTYMINNESRLSRLETQLGFVLGADANAQLIGRADGIENIQNSTMVSHAAEAFSEQCASLMSQYGSIVTDAFVVSTTVQEKLNALREVMEQVGCTQLTNK